MSAENFIKIFKDKRKNIDEVSDYADYAQWTKTNKTWFNKNRSELEDLGLSKYVGLVVSQTKADELGVGNAFKALAAEHSGNTSNEKKPIVDIIDGVPVILFSDVAFKDGIERTLDKYFGKGTSTKFKDLGLIKGHIYGFMTGAVLGARDDLYNFLTSSKNEALPIMSENEADYALNFLDILIRHLQKLDIESAELKTLSSPAFLKYNKSATNFIIELQSEVDNAASAKLVQKLAGQKSGSTGIRALVNPTSTQQKALEGILEILKSDKSFSPEEILDFKSSPSLKDLIVDEILSEGFGLSRKHPKNISSPRIKLPSNIITAYVNQEAKNKYRKDLKGTINDAKASMQKIKATKQKHKEVRRRLKNVTGAAGVTNLNSLHSLLNAQLQDVISANMGDGNSRNVLNYRTGRLASSAKVEKLSESRTGMITAFYSYMKNPYATFSEGGRQQYPKSRDPKLLISKSIREIAATQVGNRLRAVNV
jgi:hypothetical protein